MGLLGLCFTAGLAPGALAEKPPQVTVAAAPAGAKMVEAEMGGDGKIHLLFQKGNMPFYAVSADNGKTLSEPIPVIARSPVQGLEYLGWDMTVMEKGKVLVVMGNNAWKLKLPKEQWGMYIASLEPGAKEFGETKPLNGMPSEGFSIAAGKGDTVTASWLSDKKVFWKHSTDGGATWGEGRQIDENYLPCECCTTNLTVGKDGTVAMLYREASGDRRNIHLVLYKDGKHTRTRISQKPWDTDKCPMTYYKIVPAGEGYVAAWPTHHEVHFARIAADGKLWQAGEISTGGRSGMRSSIFAVPGAGGSTLVGWKLSNVLSWKIYDVAGRQIGDGNVESAGNQAGGVADKDGNFILFP
jgi:hypothetical protein